MNRRRFIQVGTLGAAGLALSGSVAGAEQAEALGPPPTLGKQPKNIIFMVADGMSLGVPTMAEDFQQTVRGKGTVLAKSLRDRRATKGFFNTASLSSLVTDSSAGGSAWGCGSRIFNGMVNMLPDGTKLTPIGRVAKDNGRAVGLVTTTTITHATPSSFAVSVSSRGDETGIADLYLETDIDFFMGGGQKFFLPNLRKDGRDLIGEFQKAGYTSLQSKKEWDKIKLGEKTLGLFYPSHLPYTLDQLNDKDLQDTVPTLAEMTGKAIESLSKSGKGFLLQVEGGRVDHAAHGNDAAALVHDQIAFDDALAVALEFARRTGDTLVIVTTDHGNANPGLNGKGSGYNGSDACFAKLAEATGSYEKLFPALEDAKGQDAPHKPETVFELVKANMAIELNPDEVAVVTAALNGEYREVYDAHKSKGGILGEALGNHNGVGFTSMSHTSDLAIVVAEGPGQARFAGLRNNNEAFGIMLDLWDIDFRNPSMTKDEAKKYLAMAPTIRKDDWA